MVVLLKNAERTTLTLPSFKTVIIRKNKIKIIKGEEGGSSSTDAGSMADMGLAHS